MARVRKVHSTVADYKVQYNGVKASAQHQTVLVLSVDEKGSLKHQKTIVIAFSKRARQ